MSSPYTAALKMLARRELSETQVRQRLARRGYEEADVDDAVARLKEQRAIDDARVAEAIARTETLVKRRGRLRVKRQIESAGIAASIAKAAVDDVFGTLDEDALLETALQKRMRGRQEIADDRDFLRLYRFLITQGFEADRVVKALAKYRHRASI